MTLTTQALSDKFGVAITGVDLSKELDDKLFNEIVDAFVKKQVLVFHNEPLTLKNTAPMQETCSYGRLAPSEPAHLSYSS